MNRVLNSTVFTDVLWKRHKDDRAWDFSNDGAISVRVVVPPSVEVVLVGSSVELGEWNPKHGVRMACEKLPLWYVPLDKIEIKDGDLFKFVLVGQGHMVWESGENRVWGEPSEQHTDQGEFRGAPSYEPRFMGVAIPLFSIRSAATEGVGDYPSLGEFAKWAAVAGMRAVQILPINDTTASHTWRDSYPYKSISIFALHPLYIRVSQIDSTIDVSELRELDRLGSVDYDRVDDIKWRLLRELFERVGAQTLASDDFAAFFDHNQEWLRPYAAFSFLRDHFSTAVFSDWPQPYDLYSQELCQKVAADHSAQVGFYYFLQFHADRQLRGARMAAHEVGVVLKGDIPIGVSRDSVEAWSEPHLFNMQGQAGAPPDDFATDGQNWGFPTYNWAAMAAQGYGWWRARFEKMADYFDMYRIDHILGFFRIWEIPMPEKSGLLGHFSPSLPFSAEELAGRGLPMCEQRYLGEHQSDHNTLFVRDHQNPQLYHPAISARSTDRYGNVLNDHERASFDALYNYYFYERHNQFWADGAFAKLPSLIDSTNMLCCAEDLGMIPASVASTLEAMQIVTLEIQRMPKSSSVLFGNTQHYPYMCVSTTSTHDIPTLREWWCEDRDKTQRYYNEMMLWNGRAPDDATAEVCRNIIWQHINSPAMAVILPLQDWLSIDSELRVPDPSTERINVPGDANHYWRYRMHLTTEQLLDAEQFNENLRGFTRVTDEGL